MGIFKAFFIGFLATLFDDGEINTNEDNQETARSIAHCVVCGCESDSVDGNGLCQSCVDDEAYRYHHEHNHLHHI